MTREEAINMLKSKMDGHTDTSYEWAETVRMAIKALEQEPCEDAISRQAVLNVIEKEQFKGDAISEIEKLSSVNPQLQENKQESYEDTISRQAVLDALTKTSGIRGDALKALYDLSPVTPQEPKIDVLNKIKAEIEEQKECRCFDDNDMYIYKTGLNDAIDIIDKYTRESEVEK